MSESTSVLVQTETVGATVIVTGATVIGTVPIGPQGPPGVITADDVVDLFTGTPDGTLFLRDDGTLADPAGGGGGLTQEQIEDLVAALIDDNSDLDWTYDDALASLVAAIKSGAVTNAMLAGSIAISKITSLQSTLDGKADDADVTTVSDGLAAHIVDTGDAHDASAISISDAAGDFDATDVEGALAELQTFDESLAGTYVPQDLSGLTGSASPDADDLVYIWLDGAPRKVALSDLAALILANAVLTGTVTIPDAALAIADTSGLQAALDAKVTQQTLAVAHGGTEHYWPGGNLIGISVLAAAANFVYYEPFELTKATTFDRIFCEVTTQIAASSTRLGIYAAGADLQPAALMFAGTEIDTSSLGDKSETINLTLPAGRYVKALTTNGAVGYRSARCSWPYGLLSGASSFPRTLIKSRAYAALPDPGVAYDTVQTVATGFEHRVWLRPL